jgi:AraC-like DNA-binding protein
LTEYRHVYLSARSVGQTAQSLALCRIIDMIENTLDQGLTLAELAAQSRLSPYHFCREFKRAMGSSPHQYVLDRRIARAREQLELGGDSLADIAYAFGFSSQAHMTSIIKNGLVRHQGGTVTIVARKSRDRHKVRLRARVGTTVV